MKPRCIALCADDFGQDESVNRAALALAERGRLNGVGCLVGAPAWRGARGGIESLVARGVDIGLHLDLTDHPIDTGVKHSLPRLIVQSHLGLLPAARLQAEIRGQLDRFEQQLGRTPDYIDGHRHVHQLPQVRTALMRALAGGARAPWLRSTRRPAALRAPAGSTWAERCKPRLIDALGARALEREASRLGLRASRHLLGVYGFSGGEAHYRAWIEAWLEAATDDDVLMCHPALGPAGTGAPADAIAAARAVEHRVLASGWMGEALARHAVTPARLGRLMRSSPAPRAP